MTAVAAYLAELAPLLDRGTRRRVLVEVESHLLEAVSTARERGEDAATAELHATARFGPPAEVARQFNAVRRGRRPRAVIRRTAAVLLASSAAASLGTATVWALEPSAAHHHHLAHHRGRHR